MIMESSKLLDFDIEKFDLNKNYSISASAGTGKTYTIVEIVKKLLINNIKEDEILIVTYTEKAAGEIKERIKNSIPSFDIEQSHIGTIHSFCKDVISEYYLSMGLPSNLALVDESKIQNVYDKLIRDYLYDNKIEINRIGNKQDKSDLKAIVKRLYLDSNGEINPNIISFNPLDKNQKLKLGVRGLKGKNEDEVLKYFLNYNDPENKDFSCKIKMIFNLFKEEISHSNDPLFKQNDRIINLWNDLYKHISEQGIFDYDGHRKLSISDMDNTLKEIKKSTIDEVIYFEEAAVDLYKRWQEVKHHNKWYSYDDMLREVHEAVTSKNCALANKLGKRFKYALIDEFQDTNQVQWNIFKNIFLDNKNNHIIVVGDRKQSIYSFQDADLTVYDSAVREIELNGGCLRNLPRNYRSSSSLINAYNMLFTTEGFKSLDYVNPVKVGCEKLDAKFDGKRIKGINVVVKKENKENSSEQTSLVNTVNAFEYAKVIVKSIADYCSFDDNGKTRLQIYDKEGIQHNVSFKDFMVLARTRSEFNAVEYELKQAGIPYVKNKGSLFGGLECAQWIAVINAILKEDFTGRNRNAFRKALYTKFFNKTLREISSPYYETDSSEEMDLILKWKRLASEYRYTDLINSILEDSKIEQRMSSLTDIQSLNIFKQIGDYSLEYLLSGNSLLDLKNNLISLSKNETGDNDDKQNVKKGIDFDCVELMTIHASKGLDRAVVFVVGGEKQNNPQNSTVNIFHKRETLVDGREITKAYLTMTKDNYKDELSNEYDRLFYVAYTRAKYLVVIPYYKDNKDVAVIKATKQFIDLDKDKDFHEEIIFDERKINITEIKEKVKSIVQNKTSNKENIQKEKEDQLLSLKALSKEMNRHFLYKHSYASMSKIKESNYILEENINYNKEGNDLEVILSGFDLSSVSAEIEYSDVESNPIPEGFPRGAKVGTALHEIFEEFEFADVDKDNNRLLSIIKERFKENNLKQSDCFENYVFNMVSDVLNANLPQINGNRINIKDSFKLKNIKCENRKAEAEFNFGLERSDLTNYCNGFIDLMFRRGDYYCLLDWKSDTINEIDLLSYNNLQDIKKRVDGHYSIQRVLYSYTLVNWLFNCGLEPTLEEVFDKHFGGIYYVFIRGCVKDTSNGIYAQTWNNFKDLENEFINIINKVKCGELKGGDLDE